MIEYGKDSGSYRIYNPQTRRITESRNVTFIETLPKAKPPAGQEKLLETNEETLQENEAYHWDILGHRQLLSLPDEDQDATKASLAPSTSYAEKERIASTGSAPRSPGPNLEGAPSSTGSSSDAQQQGHINWDNPFSKDNGTTNYSTAKITTIDRTGTRC